MAVSFGSQELSVDVQYSGGTNRDSDHIEPLQQAVVMARTRAMAMGARMRGGAVVGEVGGFGE